jgi:ADP-heptose:LPS heptosyltransferase
MANFERILLIRHSGIGDILFTLPAVNLVRMNFPGSRIVYCTKKRYAALLQGFRAVDQVIAVDDEAFRHGNPLKIARHSWRLLRAVRAGGFDLAVDLHGFGETGLIAWASRARERWGIVRHFKRRFFYTAAILRDPLLHSVDQGCQLLVKNGLQRFPPDNQFQLPRQYLAEAEKLFADCGLEPGRATIFIQPFTSSKKKNWPLEKYLECAEQWRNQGWQVLFGGGPEEKKRLAGMSARFPAAAGRSGLLTTAGLMQLSTLTVGGDTGMLHLAVALGKPALMLMRQADPQYLPYRHPDWALVSPDPKTIAAIPAEAVIAAASRIVKENP